MEDRRQRVTGLSPATRTRSRKIYDTVNAALWALLTASVVMFFINSPRIVDARKLVERERLKEVSDENRFYCEKWGMKAGTHEHVLCTLDLQEIRARVEERIASDLSW
jgi:hypothetical protein